MGTVGAILDIYAHEGRVGGSLRRNGIEDELALGNEALLPCAVEGLDDLRQGRPGSIPGQQRRLVVRGLGRLDSVIPHTPVGRESQILVRFASGGGRRRCRQSRGYTRSGRGYWGVV